MTVDNRHEQQRHLPRGLQAVSPQESKLRQSRMSEEPTPAVEVSVYTPTTGVAIVDVKVGAESTPAPLHWPAGDWTKPPLDISLSEIGRVEGVQVVFQDEVIDTADAALSTDVDVGVPLFDVDEWPADRYLDARLNVRASRLASGHLLVTIDDDRPGRLLRLGNGLVDSHSASTRAIG